MATLKETRTEVCHFVTSETDSPEASAPPAPTSSILDYPKVSPSLMEVLDLDENPFPGGPFDPGPIDPEQKADLRP